MPPKMLRIPSDFPLRLWLFYLWATFCLWAAVFIYRTSFVAPDGSLGFVLFDDAMISMRYALNLASGIGPFWNPNEPVEGYTNPLWMLYMALAITLVGKWFAPLFIQLTGLGLLILISHECLRITRLIYPSAAERDALVLWIPAAAALSYYPLVYWSLYGMEVGLLAFLLLVGIRKVLVFLDSDQSTDLLIALSCGFVAYCVRPDGWLTLSPVVLVALHGAWFSPCRTKHLRLLLIFMSLAAVAVGAQLAWRFHTYGALVPNTYTLKVEGHPLALRIANGLAFVTPYVFTTIGAYILCVVSGFMHLQGRASVGIALAVTPLISLAYQILVGGDPWPYWRQLAPTFLVLPILGAPLLANWLREFFSGDSWRMKVSAALGLGLVLAVPNAPFAREISLVWRPYQADGLDLRARIALTLKEITLPGASILTFWAGALPYFSELRALDALGKMDTHIAKLEPDLNIAWSGMRGVPGHDKYELDYSIGKLRPDYLEQWSWFGNDAQTELVRTQYQAVEYRGFLFCVRTASEFIDWEKVVRREGGCDAEGASINGQ